MHGRVLRLVFGFQLLKWVHRGDEAIHLYKSFVLDLCSAHNYYTKFAIQQLVAVFPEGQLSSYSNFALVRSIVRSDGVLVFLILVVENSLHCECAPSEQEERAFQVVHEVIRCLLRIIPM